MDLRGAWSRIQSCQSVTDEELLALIIRYRDLKPMIWDMGPEFTLFNKELGHRHAILTAMASARGLRGYE